MSSVSNGLYFLTLPLVSVMRVIYRKIRHARYLYIKRNAEKVWGARYLSKNTVTRTQRDGFTQKQKNYALHKASLQHTATEKHLPAQILALRQGDGGHNISASLPQHVPAPFRFAVLSRSELSYCLIRKSSEV